MPVRGVQTKRIIPSGISDATDGTFAFQGAMAQLGNLVPLPNARGVFVARPAMTSVATVPDMVEQGTALENVGSLFYGMKPSGLFPGNDTPFVFTGTSFTPVSGLGDQVLPATQTTSGDWTPPTIAQVGGRVIITHPGYPGGTTIPPVATGFYGNTINGSTTLEVGDSREGFRPKPGSTIYMPGVPANTTVIQSALFQFSLTGTWAANSATIQLNGVSNLWLGMHILSPGNGLDAAIVGINSGNNTVTVNNPPTVAQASSVPVTAEGVEIQMSGAATQTASNFGAIASTVSVKFGWLDISGFTTDVIGNTRAGVPYINGGFDITGIQPGMKINHPTLPLGTRVIQVENVDIVVKCATTQNSTGVSVITTFASSEISAGMTVTGPGISANTTVQSYTPSTQNVVLSQAASQTANVDLTFSGAIIVVSQEATSFQAQGTYEVSGGSPSAPLYGAGDLNINPIAGTAPPVFVAGFNGRAYYGVNTPPQFHAPTTVGVQASDAGEPGTQTFASQTLLFENGVPVTAAFGLPLFNQLGGIVQSLIVFQGNSNLQQITGDFSSNNIAVNTAQVATGTMAPNTLASTPRGLLFAAADGLRLIDFNGQVSDPLGERGQGIVTPFINVVTPTRASASFNENVYRLTITWLPPSSCQAVWGTAQRTDEFWFHLAEQGKPLEQSRWSGPHTSTQVLSAPWPAMASFLTFPAGSTNVGQLFRADPKPTQASTYTEFGVPLQCIYQSLLTPDSPDGFTHVAVETTAWIGVVSGSAEVLATATDDFGQILDQAYAGIGPFAVAAQQIIPWHTNLTFRQMSLALAVPATPQLQLGAIVMRTKPTGHQVPYPLAIPLILGTALRGGERALHP